MGYKTFISNTTATLSMAAVVGLGYSSLEQPATTQVSSHIPNSSFKSSTYDGGLKATNFSDTTQEIDAVLGFANKLISNSKPLDADIAQLVDDNLMDLLS